MRNEKPGSRIHRRVCATFLLGTGLVVLLAAGACSTFTAEDSPSPDANANTSRETDAAPADAPADVPLDGGPEPISLISPYREGEGGLTYPLTIV